MSRKEHLHEIPTHIGPITVIGTCRKTRPAGLRKPYEYVLPLKEAEALVKELKAALKGAEAKGFQCASVDRKAVSKGVRVDFFILGYAPGLCGDGEPGEPNGVSAKLYGETVKAVQGALFKYLGKDARVYADPYSLKTKFQCRFETYIKYEELN